MSGYVSSYTYRGDPDSVPCREGVASQATRSRVGDSAIKEAKDRMEACTEELGYAYSTSATSRRGGQVVESP